MKPFDAGICIEDDLTETHTLIFNKFPIKQNHVLVITKDFCKQEEILNTTDFEATCLAMKSLDESLAYFNSGKKAGASQPHKHI
jgi:ATP adenylyltransferase